jgi:membrane protease YdiL (CAAX protease family)
VDVAAPPPPPPPYAALSPPGGPGFWYRVLSPVLAVLFAFALLIVAVGFLRLAPLSEDSVASIVTFATSVLLLLFALGLRRRLPAHERRAAVAVKGAVPSAVATGVAIGLGIVVGSGLIIVLGDSIDPVVHRRLDEVESIGTHAWQVVLLVISLVVLAPLGEELLFRGLLLRGLTRRLRFGPAAMIASLVFASAHADSYALWPRAVSLWLTGLVLAWVYRRRGYWSSVGAHATVNTVAAIALIASS